MSEKFKISNLDLYYGDFHALKDINMSIHANEITAFISCKISAAVAFPLFITNPQCFSETWASPNA